MKRNILLFNKLLVSAMTLFFSILPVQSVIAEAVIKDSLITVLNPAVSTALADRVPLAPRLDTLDGKTIYLVDTNWEGMEHNTGVLEEMQEWFARNMPKVKTVIRVKRGSYMTDDKALCKEIADSGGDGIIIGVAG